VQWRGCMRVGPQGAHIHIHTYAYTLTYISRCAYHTTTSYTRSSPTTLRNDRDRPTAPRPLVRPSSKCDLNIRVYMNAGVCFPSEMVKCWSWRRNEDSFKKIGDVTDTDVHHEAMEVFWPAFHTNIGCCVAFRYAHVSFVHVYTSVYVICTRTHKFPFAQGLVTDTPTSPHANHLKSAGLAICHRSLPLHYSPRHYAVPVLLLPVVQPAQQPRASRAAGAGSPTAAGDGSGQCPPGS